MIILYRLLAAPLLVFGFLVAALFSRKVRRGVQLRLRPARPHRPFHKCIWIHAASGEYEYAKPVIRELKQQFPELPIVVTYFSPTYKGVIENDTFVDFCCPLPLDLPGPIQDFHEQFSPVALLIARTDLWPEVMRQNQIRNIPQILFSATMPTHMTRLAGFWKRWNLNQLDEIHCVSQIDADNLRQLGVKTPITVTGDTRFDQVFYRLSHPKPLPNLPPTPSSCLTIVAGSTWPEDETQLLPALANLISSKKIRLLLVPHEPTPSHVASLIEQTKKLKIQTQTWTQYASSDFEVMIVDQVGLLAELYTQAEAAFVGGSYRKTVHSVMEPLACGLPVIVGPRIQNNREAQVFSNFEIAPNLCAVTVCADSEHLKTAVETLCTQDLHAIRATIQSEVQKHQGSSQRFTKSLTQRLH